MNLTDKKKIILTHMQKTQVTRELSLLLAGLPMSEISDRWNNDSHTVSE